MKNFKQKKILFQAFLQWREDESLPLSRLFSVALDKATGIHNKEFGISFKKLEDFFSSFLNLVRDHEKWFSHFSTKEILDITGFKTSYIKKELEKRLNKDVI